MRTETALTEDEDRDCIETEDEDRDCTDRG